MKKYHRNVRSGKRGAGAQAAAAAGAYQGFAEAASKSLSQFWAWFWPAGQLIGRKKEWKKWWR